MTLDDDSLIDFQLNNTDTTYAEYQNYKNVLFQLSQELNNAVVLFVTDKDINYNINKKNTIEKYLKLYPQIINIKSIKNKLSRNELRYLRYFYGKPNVINKKSAQTINSIVFKLFDKFGIYNISKQQESYR